MASGIRIIKRYKGMDYVIHNQTEWFSLLHYMPSFDREARLVKDFNDGRRR